MLRTALRGHAARDARRRRARRAACAGPRSRRRRALARRQNAARWSPARTVSQSEPRAQSPAMPVTTTRRPPPAHREGASPGGVKPSARMRARASRMSARERRPRFHAVLRRQQRRPEAVEGPAGVVAEPGLAHRVLDHGEHAHRQPEAPGGEGPARVDGAGRDSQGDRGRRGGEEEAPERRHHPAVQERMKSGARGWRKRAARSISESGSRRLAAASSASHR